MSVRAQQNHRIEWLTLGLFAGFYAAWLVVILANHARCPGRLPWRSWRSWAASTCHCSTRHCTVTPPGGAGSTPLWRSPRCHCGCRTSATGRATCSTTTPTSQTRSSTPSPSTSAIGLVVRRCGQAQLHPRDANHDRAPDHRIDSQHLPVRVARVAHVTSSRATARRWAAHLVAQLCWFGGCSRVVEHPCLGVPRWVSSSMGQSFTLLRSFVEHCAVAEGTRSAVVKAGPVMSLMYLNNNLHHTHHAEPSTPWYALPSVAPRSMEADEIAAEGAGLYRHGYLEVARRNFARPFCQPDHPLSPGARPFGARGLR